MVKNASNYATLLGLKKILYLPTCLIIERMAGMYGHLVRLQTVNKIPEDELANIITLLKRFVHDLNCTMEAYRQGSVRMFTGDWKVDRIKASRIFANLMLRMGRVYTRTINPYRQWLRGAMGNLNREWIRLFNLLDARSFRNVTCPAKTNTRYFHSTNHASWQSTMAHTLLCLDKETEYESDDTHLILVCYSKVKEHLLTNIEEIEERNKAPRRFASERILCASCRDVHLNCPACMRFTDNIVNSGQTRWRTQTGVLATLGSKSL